MTAETGRLRRSDRLRESRDFKRVAARGDRYASNAFVLLVAPGGPGSQSPTRLGVTASRRVGNAVVRNRLKRAIRGWFRVSRENLTNEESDDRALDIVVIARKPAVELDAKGIAANLSGLVGRRNKHGGQGSLSAGGSSA